MVRFRIECDLPFSRPDFWRLRASPAFLAFIVADGLLKKMEASPTQYDPDGWASRRQHYCPARVDCPNIVRAAVGDTMFEVDDEQRWNDLLAPFHQHFFIRPSFLAGMSKTSGTLTVELHPDYALPDKPDEEPAAPTVDDAQQLPEGDHPDDSSAAMHDASSCDDGSSSSAVMDKPDEEPAAPTVDDAQQLPEGDHPDDSSAAMHDASSCDDGSSSSAVMDEGSAAEADDPDHADDALSSAGTATDPDCSDAGDSTDSSDAECSKEPLDADALLAALPPADKSLHVVTGETRVSILTLGWFIERAIVHNLRNFYKAYPATITRFRQWIYQEFADGDDSVPCSIVVDRFLECEAQREREAQLETEALRAEEEQAQEGDSVEIEAAQVDAE